MTCVSWAAQGTRGVFFFVERQVEQSLFEDARVEGTTTDPSRYLFVAVTTGTSRLIFIGGLLHGDVRCSCTCAELLRPL